MTATINSKPVITPKPEDLATRFVVVRAGEYRRGLRLEEIFWRALKDVAAGAGLSLGAFVRAVEQASDGGGNATSRLRVLCMGCLMDKLLSVQNVANRGLANSLVQASPSPTFALATDRRIVSYNQSFLNLIQARLSIESSSAMARNLRLSLDLQIVELIDALRLKDNMPVGTGFVIGVDNQRFRGRVNAVLTPVIGQAVIICYVLPD
ncbi:ribbon-helix-helix domain-containing protein [Flaviflagellibacter deserti]|uniref:Ribbon-helix-helix domain-containing protein n=1 Tax=Flaviflagellibacter deserti TaxID=2267266 RepID=A0ABV9Z940_9HYPH